jgi:CIC family chloride channel protein
LYLKTFAHCFFSLPTYINGILKLSFINSILPIAGLLFTVLRQRVLGGTIRGLLKFYMQLQRKPASFQKKQMYAHISPVP